MHVRERVIGRKMSQVVSLVKTSNIVRSLFLAFGFLGLDF